MGCWSRERIDGMFRFIGTTVTIFTTSGGISGSGFTGTLVSVDEDFIRLLVVEGGPPTFPIGVWPCQGNCVPCCGDFDGCSNGFPNGFFSGGWPCNQFGSIVIIPTDSIAAFTHNAI